MWSLVSFRVTSFTRLFSRLADILDVWPCLVGSALPTFDDDCATITIDEQHFTIFCWLMYATIAVMATISCFLNLLPQSLSLYDGFGSHLAVKSVFL